VATAAQTVAGIGDVVTVVGFRPMANPQFGPAWWCVEVVESAPGVVGRGVGPGWWCADAPEPRPWGLGDSGE
jgi:hypothetical protein